MKSKEDHGQDQAVEEQESEVEGANETIKAAKIPRTQKVAISSKVNDWDKKLKALVAAKNDELDKTLAKEADAAKKK